ncbi:MAG: AAA family ATPase [Candidatus Saccharimonadales bacterium]
MKADPQLLLSSLTLKQLEKFIDHPGHGILISGPSGSGKTSVIDLLASNLLNIDAEKLETYPYIYRLILVPKTKNISIDSVREIDKFFGHAVPGHLAAGHISRIVIIDDAENLSLAAQNALLKNLEEPPIDSTFLLSTSQPNQLLETLKSRLTTIRLAGVSKEEIKKFLISRSIDDHAADTSIAMSGGIPGLAIALALNQTDHKLIKASETARSILSANQHQKLIKINLLSKDPKLALDTISILQQMARYSLETAEDEQSKRWQNVLKYSFEAEKRLNQKANLRLTLTQLILHI